MRQLTTPQFIAFAFMIGWVCGQVVKSDYKTCMILGLFTAFIWVWSKNVHKEAFQNLKSYLVSLKKK